MWAVFHNLCEWVQDGIPFLTWNVKRYPGTFKSKNTWIYSSYLSFSSHSNKTLDDYYRNVIGTKLSLVLAHNRLSIRSEFLYVRYLDPLGQNTKVMKRRLFPLFDCYSHWIIRNACFQTWQWRPLVNNHHCVLDLKRSKKVIYEQYSWVRKIQRQKLIISLFMRMYFLTH